MPPFLFLRSSNPAAAAVTSQTNTTLPPPGLPLGIPPADPSEYNGGSVIPVAVVAAVLSTAFVAMRFYVRVRLLRSVKWDDWFILTSLVFAVATSGGMIAQLNYGLGAHLQFVWDTFPLYVQAGIFTNLFYSVSLTLTKVSILLLYIRILTYDLVRLLGKVLLGVVLVSHTWIIVSILTTCIPLSAAWDYDPANPPVYCHPVPVFWVNAMLHLLTDFMIFMLPLPVISSMSLPRRQKMGLYFVFCLAFLVCAISITRLTSFFHTDETQDEVMDITWSAVRIANWTVVEVHIAIVTACLTTLKPLLSAFFPALVSPAPIAFTTAAAEARRRKDFEDNFTTGDLEGYQRPLTIGTKSNRPPVRRDTFASLVADVKSGGGEHVEVATPTSATKLATVTAAEGSEFRLPEVQPPSPFGRFSSWARGSRLQIPMVSRGPSTTSRHERLGSRSTITWGSVRHERYESIDRQNSSPPPPVPGRRLI